MDSSQQKKTGDVNINLSDKLSRLQVKNPKMSGMPPQVSSRCPSSPPPRALSPLFHVSPYMLPPIDVNNNFSNYRSPQQMHFQLPPPGRQPTPSTLTMSSQENTTFPQRISSE